MASNKKVSESEKYNSQQGEKLTNRNSSQNDTDNICKQRY